MYQGKHSSNVQPAVRRPAARRPAARRSGKRKATVLLSSLALLIALAVGTTAAFLITNDEPIVNTFNPSRVASAVNEDSFDEVTKTGVTVANTGDTEAYIRATYVVTWKNENGQVYGKVPQPVVNYSISINTADWILGSDGYYYYKSPVAPGKSTTALINSCTVIGTAPEGFGLNVEILGSAIQSTPVKVVNESWKAVSVDAATRQLVG